MGLSDLRRNDDAEEAREAARKATFERRIHSQQHLRNHGPILTSMLHRAGWQDVELGGGEFVRRVQLARALAIKIYARIENVPESTVDVSKAAPHRGAASQFVADSLRHKVEPDLDRVAEDVARVFRESDSGFERDLTPWAKITGRGQIALTVTDVMLALYPIVTVYDFRMGRDEVVSALVDVVVRESAAAVDAMLPDEGATPSDRRTLMQSVLRSFVGHLTVIYEIQVDDTLKDLVGKPEEERLLYLRSVDPFGLVVERFRGVCRGGANLCVKSVEHIMADLARPASERQPLP